MRSVISLVVSSLRLSGEMASRAEAAYWLLRGRPVIYGAHLEGPLKINGGTDLLVSHVTVTGEKPRPPYARSSAFETFLPDGWT